MDIKSFFLCQNERVNSRCKDYRPDNSINYNLQSLKITFKRDHVN